MYTTNKKKRLLDAALVLSAVGALYWGLTGCAAPESNTTTKAAKTSTAKKKPKTSIKAAKTVWSDGMYSVPDEIKPGEYETEGSQDGCGWERLRDSSGSFRSIIANDLFQGPGKMTVKETDAFVKFSLGCNWERDN